MFKKGDKVKLKGGENHDTYFDYPGHDMEVTYVYHKDIACCDIFEETEGLSQPVYCSDIELVGEEGEGA